MNELEMNIQRTVEQYLDQSVKPLREFMTSLPQLSTRLSKLEEKQQRHEEQTSLICDRLQQKVSSMEDRLNEMESALDDLRGLRLVLEHLVELLNTSGNELNAAETLKSEFRDLKRQLEELAKAIKTEQARVQDLNQSLTQSGDSATQLIDSVRLSLSGLGNSVTELQGAADELRMKLKAPAQGASKWSGLAKTQAGKST